MNFTELILKRHLEVWIFHKAKKLMLNLCKISKSKEKSYQVIFNTILTSSIWCKKMILATQWKDNNLKVFANQFLNKFKVFLLKWDNNLKLEILIFTVLNWLVEAQESLLSFNWLRRTLSSNHQELWTPVSQLPEDALYKLPLKVLFSEFNNTHSMKESTMELNFIGISSKIITTLVLIQPSIQKLKEKWFMILEPKFLPVRQSNSKEESQSKFLLSINLQF